MEASYREAHYLFFHHSTKCYPSWKIGVGQGQHSGAVFRGARRWAVYRDNVSVYVIYKGNIENMVVIVLTYYWLP